MFKSDITPKRSINTLSHDMVSHHALIWIHNIGSGFGFPLSRDDSFRIIGNGQKPKLPFTSRLKYSYLLTQTGDDTGFRIIPHMVLLLNVT